MKEYQEIWLAALRNGTIGEIVYTLESIIEDDTGSTDELTNWGDGVAVTQPCAQDSPRLYMVSVEAHGEKQIKPLAVVK